MKQALKNFVNKFPLLIGFVILAVVGILPFHWMDVAQKPFWSIFWSVLGILTVVGCVAGWLFWWAKEDKK